MKIAILGAGNIGGTLGKKWAAAGHEVIFGVRDSQSPKTRAAVENSGGKTRAVSVEEAVHFGEVVLISVPWGTVPEVVAANAAGLGHKIIIDSTNHFAGPVINNLKCIQDNVPSAIIFRAFNSLGWEIFAEPQIGQVLAVERLIAEVGVRPIWVGGNERVEAVDHVGSLWVALVSQRGWQRRRIAFKLLE